MKLKTNIRYLTHISPPVNAAIAAVCPHTHNTEWKSKDPSVSRCLTGARACGCVCVCVTLRACEWVCSARTRKTHDRHKLTASFLLPKINFAIVCSVRQNRSCQRSNTFCIHQVAIFGGLMKIAHIIYLVTLVRDFRGIFFLTVYFITRSTRSLFSGNYVMMEWRHRSHSRAQRFLPLISGFF